MDHGAAGVVPLMYRRIRRATRARGVVAAALVLSACTLACSLLTGASDLQEVNGNGVDASSLDARVADTRGADVRAEARMDAPPRDVVAADEGKPDVFVDWCASQSPAPLFCSDFDTTPMPWGWDSVVAKGGSVMADPHAFESAPYSLYAATTAASTGYLETLVEKTFSEPLGNSTFAFDLYFETIDPGALYDKVAILTLGGESPSWTLFLQLPSATRMDVVVQSPVDGGVSYVDYPFTPDGSAPVVGKWMHVEIDTKKAASGVGIGQFQVLLDGQVVLAPVSVTSAAAFGAPKIQLGLAGIGTPTGPWVLRVDNVTFNMD
jgi:hypothetical protein